MRSDNWGGPRPPGNRRLRPVLILLMVLVIGAASADADADARGKRGRGHPGGHHATRILGGGHHPSPARVGVGLGVVLAVPAFSNVLPLPYYPPLAAAPSAPPIYIEQASAPDQPAGYWYYCAEAQAYYPYVKECQGAWQPVAPQASPDR